MTPERWQQIKAAFAEVRELPPDGRGSRLTQMLVHDAEMHREVVSLLDADRAAGGFLEQPPLAQIDRAVDLHTGLPSRIGSYRIVREIGRGGMGVVLLGSRDDDTYQKDVAIKVIRPGADQGLLRRFTEERRILAQLTHPNIAVLLDGGETERGEPFLVMEYIDGKPIDAHCDAAALSIDERLRLFVPVCAAVQHAHQRLVVHRDIKPANILVTAEGVPKLLDFGIAKLLAEGAGPGATVTVAQLLTPEYASPEQIRNEAITVATDVYALGVVLYRLLTGMRPYAPTTDRPHELARAICEDDPARPSSQRRMAGELDTIVLKALQKDPERRYSSVEAFAADITRYLDGRPVLAHADSLTYRATKFVRRYRVAVAAAAAVAVAVIGGTAATFWQWRAAVANQAIAERRFNDLRNLTRSMFEFHDAIAKLPGTTKARELVVRRALEYLDMMAAEPESDDALRAELASAYEKVGDVQGLPYVPSLGDTAGARRSYERAFSLYASLVQKQPGDAERQASACRAGARLGSVLLAQSDVRAAQARLREFLPSCEKAWRRPDLSSDPEAFRARIILGDFNRRINDLAAARTIYRSVIAEAGARSATDPSVRIFVLQANDRMSQIAELTGDLAEALSFRRRQIEIAERLVQEDPANAYYRRVVGVGQASLALLLGAGENSAALAAAARAAEVYRALLTEDPDNARAALDVARIHVTLGRLLRRAGRLQEAHRAFSEARSRAETAARLNPASTEASGTAAEALADLGTTLTEQGRPKEAIALLLQALEVQQGILLRDPDSHETQHAVAGLHGSLGRARSRTGALAEGCRSYAIALQMLRDLQRRAVPPVPTTDRINALSREQSTCTRPEKAEPRPSAASRNSGSRRQRQ